MESSQPTCDWKAQLRASMAAYLQVVAQGTHDLLDLLRQLAGWGQHKSLALRDVEVQCQTVPAE
eukprot:365412-Chlamydomonas_euryale.AAC.16